MRRFITPPMFGLSACIDGIEMRAQGICWWHSSQRPTIACSKTCKAGERKCIKMGHVSNREQLKERMNKKKRERERAREVTQARKVKE